VQEEWKEIIWAPGYHVSNLGRVKSILRRGPLGANYLERDLTPSKVGGKADNQYMRVAISLKRVGQGMRYCKVHRLVAEAFIPNPENKPEPNHIDGDKSNNRVDNLEWATKTEQMKHAINVLGFNPSKYAANPQPGETNGHHKLTEAMVIMIRESEKSAYALAKELGMDRNHISEVRLRRFWAHLPETAKELQIRQAREKRTGIQLTQEQIAEIRSSVGTNRSLAEKYGVCERTIWRCRRVQN
jgi:hypothetical protein